MTATETRTEWAVRYTHFDNTVTYETAGDRGHAELIADGKATYLASLNEPTHEFVGIDEVDVVSRTVAGYDDGAKMIGAWRLERPAIAEVRA